MITRYGMYSIVSVSSTHVQVRARVKRDLQQLRKQFDLLEEDSLKPAAIFETPDRDYPYRMVLHRRDFALVAAELAADVDYPNFKAEVARTNPTRARIYERVWMTLLALQPVSFKKI